MATELKLAPESDRSIMPAISIAALVLLTVAIIVFLVNPRETAALSVDKIQEFAPHTATHALRGQISVLTDTPAGEDNLYVVAQVQVTDKIRLPLFITGATATLVNADGTSVDTNSVSPVLYPRLEKIFPEITPMLQGDPIRDGDEVAPGETRKGMVLLMFPGLKQSDWQSKKSAVLSINLRNQAAQTIKLP